MAKFRWAAGATGLAAVAACSDGGSGGDAGGPLPVPAAPSSFAAHAAAFASLQAGAAGEAQTDPATLPMSGGATFAGGLGLGGAGDSLSPSGVLRADPQVAAGFGSDTIEASAVNLVTGGDVQPAGEVRFEDGTVERHGDEFTGHAVVAGVEDGASSPTTPDGEVFAVRDGYQLDDFGGEDGDDLTGQVSLRLDDPGPGVGGDGGGDVVAGRE